jgi:hypothetical protein
MQDRQQLAEILGSMEKGFQQNIDILLQLNSIQEKNQFQVILLLQKLIEKNDVLQGAYTLPSLGILEPSNGQQQMDRF